MSDNKYNLLLLDDETEILNALRRVFRRQYNVFTCDNGEQALEIVKEHPIAVIISDMRMPHMDGATFLAHAKEISPKTIRILLTGYSDIESTARAINDAEIFSYVSKPWNNTDLQLVVSRALERYQLDEKVEALNQEVRVKNEQLTIVNQGLEEKVAQRTKALQESNSSLSSTLSKQRAMFQGVLEMINSLIGQRIGGHFGHNKRVATHCRMLAEWMGQDAKECTHIYLAAMMYDIGKVTLSDELLSMNESSMNPAQSAEFQSYVTRGAEIVEAIPSLASAVGKIIRSQNEWFTGGGFPGELHQESIPISARILKVVKDYDNLLLGELDGTKHAPAQALRYLQEDEFGKYDKAVVAEYSKVLNELSTNQHEEIEVGLLSSQLRSGMRLAQDISFDDKNVNLKANSELTAQAIERIKSLEENRDRKLTIFATKGS